MRHNSSCSALTFSSLSPHPCPLLQRFYQPLRTTTPRNSSDYTATNWAVLVSKIIQSHSPGCKRTGTVMIPVTEWGRSIHPACWGEPRPPRFLRASWALRESTCQHNTSDQRLTLRAVPFLPTLGTAPRTRVFAKGLRRRGL